MNNSNSRNDRQIEEQYELPHLIAGHQGQLSHWEISAPGANSQPAQAQAHHQSSFYATPSSNAPVYEPTQTLHCGFNNQTVHQPPSQYSSFGLAAPISGTQVGRLPPQSFPDGTRPYLEYSHSFDQIRSRHEFGGYADPTPSHFLNGNQVSAGQDGFYGPDTVQPDRQSNRVEHPVNTNYNTGIGRSPHDFEPGGTNTLRPVGSAANTEAAIGNRRNRPVYFCNVPGCTSQGFTQRHNYECESWLI
ncbi:hypothetical protein PM082_011354 [Marasmius tenuissimus]|nr:hypothetical protein PM082_011354 [Marasmius tenuissimus]